MASNVGITSPAMASWSPVSTLQRQYEDQTQLLVFVKCDTACCVPLEEVLRARNERQQMEGGIVDDYTADASNSSSAGSAGALNGLPGDDPFDPANAAGAPGKKTNQFGKFLKKVAVSGGKALERGMHQLAVRADAGKSPDSLVIGVFAAENKNLLLCATEPEPIPTPEETASGVQFRIPLAIPKTFPGRNVVLQLYIRSGAALVSSKHYLVAETAPLHVGQLRDSLANRSSFSLTVPINSKVLIDGHLQCVLSGNTKFPTSDNGWFLSDPDPRSAYAVQAAGMFHYPLTQSYGFSYAGDRPQEPIMVATERTVESSVVLPIAAAFHQLAAKAALLSLDHAKDVATSLLAYRHDSYPPDVAFADVALRISHLQSNMASTSILQGRSATITASFQRPNSIFEVQVLEPTRLPLYPTAADGFRPDISCRFYPKAVFRKEEVLPTVLQLYPGNKLPGPNNEFALGTVRIQVSVPKRLSDQSTNAASESQFDPNSPWEEIWECIIPIEHRIDQANSSPSSSSRNQEYAIVDPKGHSMGNLFLNMTVSVVRPTTQAKLGAIKPVGGLPALMGMPKVLPDGIQPVLDFPEASFGSEPPQELRRRSQLLTMGKFMTYKYLEENIKTQRAPDAKALQERAELYRKALDARASEHLPSHLDRSPKPFRPSASRSTPELSGIGFNVHNASLSTDRAGVFYNITCGCPADHAAGYSKRMFAGLTESPIGPISGGLRRLEKARLTLAEHIVSSQNQLTMNVANQFASQSKRSIQPATHIASDNIDLQGLRWRIFESIQCMNELTWSCAVRRANVFSQALGIAMTSFLASVCDPGKAKSNWPGIWAKHGFLVSYEGLLTAAGKELGMIEDASVGIAMLRRVHIVLSPDDGKMVADRVPVPFSQQLRWIHMWTAQEKPDSSPEFILQVGMERSFFQSNKIPAALKNKSTVTLYPLLFEVGVDIFQAASNAGSNLNRGVSTATCNPDLDSGAASDDEDDALGTSDTDVLVQLNYEAFRELNGYCQAVSPRSDGGATHPLLATLYQHIVSSSGKMNHDILVEAAALVQQMGGGAVVFCKSGKDRTAMHGTATRCAFFWFLLGF